MKIPPLPDFRSPAFLDQHIRWVMDFYAKQATDASGGMFHYFLDDGTVFDARTRHLVNATRFVITHAMLYKLTGEERFQKGVRHAVDFLRTAFFDPAGAPVSAASAGTSANQSTSGDVSPPVSTAR